MGKEALFYLEKKGPFPPPDQSVPTTFWLGIRSKTDNRNWNVLYIRVRKHHPKRVSISLTPSDAKRSVCLLNIFDPAGGLCYLMEP